MKKAIFFCSALIVLMTSCGETKQPDVDSSVTSTKDTASNQTSEPITIVDPKVFYYDYTESRGVEEALVMSKDDALSEMKKLPEVDGNFFGMELSNGSIVQFMYDEKKATWFLDIPNPVTQESYNADVTLDDALNIISNVYAGKSAEIIMAAYN